MRPPSPGRPRPHRRWRRWLVQVVWAVAVTQILLIVTDPGGLRERLGPVLFATSVTSLLLLTATARRITHQPQPPPTTEAGSNGGPSEPGSTATAVGGPCDGTSWQLGPDQLPAPRQVWLTANGASHCYQLVSQRLPGASTSLPTLTYSHHPTATTDSRPS